MPYDKNVAIHLIYVDYSDSYAVKKISREKTLIPF